MSQKVIVNIEGTGQTIELDAPEDSVNDGFFGSVKSTLDNFFSGFRDEAFNQAITNNAPLSDEQKSQMMQKMVGDPQSMRDSILRAFVAPTIGTLGDLVDLGRAAYEPIQASKGTPSAPTKNPFVNTEDVIGYMDEFGITDPSTRNEAGEMAMSLIPVGMAGTVGKADDVADLMFLHNTSAENIDRFEEIGGLPMPSLAATRSSVPFEGYGDITLIGRPDAFDPAKSRLNTVYDADAYTVRAPSMVRVAKKKAYDIFDDMFSDISKQYDGYLDDVRYKLDSLSKKGTVDDSDYSGVTRFIESDKVADIAFVKDMGVDIPVDDSGRVNMRELRDISRNLFPQERKEWNTNKMDELFDDEKYFINNPDRDRYSSRASLKPYTADNVTAFMKKRAGRGMEGGFTSSGFGAQRASTTRELKTLDAMRGAKGSIKPESEIQSLSKVQSDNFDDIADRLSEFYDYDSDSMFFRDEVSELIKMSESKGMNSALKEIGFSDVPKDLVSDIEKYKTMLRESPTQYFESKPKRTVDLSEFAGAIVPESTPQSTIDRLGKYGIKVERYDPLNPESRTLARQKFKDQMFSLAPYAAGGALGYNALSTDDEQNGI